MCKDAHVESTQQCEDACTDAGFDQYRYKWSDFYAYKECTCNDMTVCLNKVNYTYLYVAIFACIVVGCLFSFVVYKCCQKRKKRKKDSIYYMDPDTQYQSFGY